jgi:hypothetical protein
VLALDRPAGNYSIETKGTLQENSTHATCILYADGDRDTVDIYSVGPFFLSVLGGSPGPFTVHLACNDRIVNNQSAYHPPVSDLKINAVAVKDITNSAG